MYIKFRVIWSKVVDLHKEHTPKHGYIYIERERRERARERQRDFDS